MVILDASRRNQRVPRLAAWSLGCAIAATISANLAHGLNHGPIGALISAWPALALVGSYELLMHLVRTHPSASPANSLSFAVSHAAPPDAPSEPATVPALEQAVCELHQAGHSQRAIARDLSIDRRKVKNIIVRAA
jgi:DNA-binding NarL/FixJ family response regulator